MQARGLVIVSQDSLAREEFNKEGKKFVVHTVVKKSPFVIRLQPSVKIGSDFTVIAELIYSEEKKPVSYVNKPPLKYRSYTDDEGCVLLEAEVLVLTSHHEYLLFRLKMHAERKNRIIPNTTCFSEPIKVVSKPDIVKPKETKRNSTFILKTINTVYHKQMQHKTLTQNIFDTLLVVKKRKRQKTSAGPAAEDPADFEGKFYKFFGNFVRTPPDVRPRVVSTLTRSLPPEYLQNLGAFVEVFWACLMHPPQYSTPTVSSPSTPSEAPTSYDPRYDYSRGSSFDYYPH